MFYIKKVDFKHVKIMFNWRNNIINRKCMINNKKFSYSEHKIWFNKNIFKKTNFYFVLYWKRRIVGFGNIVNIDRNLKLAEWGLYKSPHSNINLYSGIALYLTCLIIAFERFGLKQLQGIFVEHNHKIRKLHKFFGVKIKKNINKGYNNLPTCSTVISHSLWKKIKSKYWNNFPGNLNKNLKTSFKNI